jgi:hypothetical protein
LGPRERRLVSDHRRLMTAFHGEQAVQIRPVGPVPPERYRVVYRLPSLRLTQQGKVVRVEETTVDLLLPVGYPREKPYITTTEPVFHPNFGAHVCVVDHWSPGDSFVDLVADIADLLQYRRYSTRSPINRPAAQWAGENAAHFPLGLVDLRPAPTEAAPGQDTKPARTEGAAAPDSRKVMP